jgi:antitoxin (DNA-binding transcriptional repressor) of toxin-antitoxin stability system
MKAVGIRELKDKLSRYLDEVKRGEVILVTDRGVVIAELRQPSEERAALTPLEQRLRPYVEQGVISPAVARESAPHYGRPSFSAAAADIDRLLDEERGES